jgi:hypothetical protein
MKVRKQSLLLALILTLSASAYVSGCVANDVEGPKQEFRTREDVAKYREAAWAHFRKRCEDSARETINRAIENVESIFLIRPRQRARESDLVDQFWMGDPYGYSLLEAMDPAGTYLYDRSGNTISGRKFTPIKGYRYVETANPRHREDPNSAPYLRYQLESVAVVNRVTGEIEHRIEPRAKEADALLSQYGITWEDISTREDRNYWVAGGKLSVINLLNDEVIGERVGYVIDPRFGDTSQGRRIWLAVSLASSAFCPPFENDFHRNKEFVARVLKARPEASDGK